MDEKSCRREVEGVPCLFANEPSRPEHVDRVIFRFSELKRRSGLVKKSRGLTIIAIIAGEKIQKMGGDGARNRVALEQLRATSA